MEGTDKSTELWHSHFSSLTGVFLPSLCSRQRGMEKWSSWTPSKLIGIRSVLFDIQNDISDKHLCPLFFNAEFGACMFPLWNNQSKGSNHHCSIFFLMLFYPIEGIQNSTLLCKLNPCYSALDNIGFHSTSDRNNFRNKFYSGARVKLACVNWYGFQLEDLVLNGLDRQPLEKITSRIVELGFNCVRLVYALDVFYKNPVCVIFILFLDLKVISVFNQ